MPARRGLAAPRRAVLSAGAALAAGGLLEPGAPQRAGAKVVSSDWELVRRHSAGSLLQLFLQLLLEPSRT